MSFKIAIFKNINGTPALLCSKCGKVIKLGKDFDEMEKHAYKGTITMMADYCDKHKDMAFVGVGEEIERQEIKKKLREGIMRKNVLGIEITRPTQKLVIMRGIPGSGKSTKAQTLVGEGVIHSTDTLIEATGDYNGYFKRMVESGDWSEHSRMHGKNFRNAKASIEAGISPVVIDNTNIKASEPKNYIEVALRLGLDEANIKIVDVGDGGCTAEILAERNTHNVPLKTIQRMLASHKGVGTLTVNKIIESKGGIKDEAHRVLYSGVMINEKSKSILLSKIGNMIPEGWKTFAHHMTISFGEPLGRREDIGKEFELLAYEVGISDMAMAVKVDGYPSNNEIPHITVAVNVAEGGKPFMSNKITNWSPLDTSIKLSGIVQEVTK